MNKPHKYYVSYSHDQGFGCIEITLLLQITTYKQILDIAEYIAKECNLGKAIILFYTKLG